MAGMRYSKLEADFDGQEDFESPPEVRRRRTPNLFKSPPFTTAVAFCVGILATFGAIKLGESIGKHDTDWLSKSSKFSKNLLGYEIHGKVIEPPGNVKVQFEYNDTYPGPPTIESEYAWLDLLPDGLGAVQHNDLSDAIVTLSVFHQLHCLMALRHAVYDDWNGTRHSHMTPHHYRHCLEYLRQSIMCNADTNVEYRVVGENGAKETPGWDVKRCRDYDAARRWAQEWRAFDGKVPSKKEEITDPDILQGRVIEY